MSKPSKSGKGNGKNTPRILAILAILFTFCTLGIVAYTEIVGTRNPRNVLFVETIVNEDPVPEVIILPVPEIMNPIEVTQSTHFDSNRNLFDYNDTDYSDYISDTVNVRVQSAETPAAPKLPIQLMREGLHSEARAPIDQGVGRLQIDPSTGFNLLHHLTRSYHYYSMEAVLIWLSKNHSKHKIDFYGFVNMKSNDEMGGDTPLHLAVTHPVPALAYLTIELLLRFGADPAVPNAAGLTAGDLIASHPDKMRMRTLNRENSADIRYDSWNYLKCAYPPVQEHKVPVPPADPIHWLIKGSSDEFIVTDTRGYPLYEPK